jgi:hypothetical protein
LRNDSLRHVTHFLVSNELVSNIKAKLEYAGFVTGEFYHSDFTVFQPKPNHFPFSDKQIKYIIDEPATWNPDYENNDTGEKGVIEGFLIKVRVNIFELHSVGKKFYFIFSLFTQVISCG